MNITEDYVSFEIAKLLKEKGFDVPCNCYGAYNGVNLTYRLCITDKYTNWNKHTSKVIISCPTLQMAMKWLLQKHRLYVNVAPSVEGYYWTEKWHSYVEELNKRHPFGRFINTFESYEEAAEAAIKYCLENLI